MLNTVPVRASILSTVVLSALSMRRPPWVAVTSPPFWPRALLPVMVTPCWPFRRRVPPLVSSEAWLTSRRLLLFLLSPPPMPPQEVLSSRTALALAVFCTPIWIWLSASIVRSRWAWTLAPWVATLRPAFNVSSPWLRSSLAFRLSLSSLLLQLPVRRLEV